MGSPPTDQTVIKRLPVVKISKKHCKAKEGSKELEAPVCTVCYDDIAIGKKGMFIPCGHIFHPKCIKPWLKEHSTCPVCRYELPTENVTKETEEEEYEYY
jgi:E3 ubiquitin-protein ligase AIP2